MTGKDAPPEVKIRSYRDSPICDVVVVVHGTEMVLRCPGYQRPCPGPARKLLNLVAEGANPTGRARVGLINRAVDIAITPAIDEAQWGVEDHWSSPFETLQTHRGDCEDYAIVKYVALRQAGLPTADVKIVILRSQFPNE
jgi:predicted transglutaminase-like cysteine proteinase